MKSFHLFFLAASIIFLFSLTSQAQDQVYIQGKLMEIDKCGYMDDENSALSKILAAKWDYGYDSLLIELNSWRLSPYVKIDSIGLSVQQRPLWRLTISDDPENISTKRTIHVHARTHPQETEGFWVTREMIKIMLSENELAKRIRSNCVVYVIPMFNPDGVELEKPRRNANEIDLESNWYTFPNQPEVAALKASFTELMSKPNPIEVMLNMHSSSLCERYFVYHHENGTSVPFTIKEQNFINGISSYFPGGFAPWNFYVSWASGTPLQYPESWFWMNYGENVMAITYEDKYRYSCTSGYYDSTANAILRGVMDYMGIATDVDYAAENIPDGFKLYQNYPNPFNPSTKIRFSIPNVGSGFALTVLKVYDILGNEVATLVNEYSNAGSYEIDFNVGRSSNTAFASGTYFYRLQIGNYISTKKMIYLK